MSSMMTTTLPSPRDVLTALISSLPNIPIATDDEDTGTNPLRLVPRAYRPLLTTLHVLYPSTLLPALDLLDRRLVARVVLHSDSTRTEAKAKESHLQDGEGGTPTLYYLVSSSQPHGQSTGPVYVVRLSSWNCTCAAFAFAAFPPTGGYDLLTGSNDDRASDGEQWEFGGLSRSEPCCKHLLACVLAEKWETVLGRYVEERRVGRAEGAGLVADL